MDMQPMSSDVQWAIETSPTVYRDGDLNKDLSCWVARPWLRRVVAGIASAYRKPLGLVKALAQSQMAKGQYLGHLKGGFKLAGGATG